MVTSANILDLVGTQRWTGMTQGRAGAQARRAQAPGTYRPRRAQFLSEASQIPKAPRPTYVHPERTPTAISYRREAGTEDLTPAELMWLQRLPLDPKDVTHDDAARLAGMYGSINRMKNPSSHQLVASIWKPVKELHDLKHARQEVEIARDSLAKLPASVRDALVEALSEEHPDWPTAGLSAHAEELLAARLEMRDRQHEATVNAAEAKLQRLEAEVSDRQVLVRETA